MKKNIKYTLAIFLAMSVCVNVMAFDMKYRKTLLEITGGSGYTAMDDWNGGMDSTFDTLVNLGQYIENWYYYSTAPFFSVEAGNIYDTGTGLLFLSLKYSYLSLSEPDMNFTWSNSMTSNRIITLLRPSFFGISAKYGMEFFKADFPGLDIYAGADIGAWTTYGSQRTLSYYGSGEPMAEYHREFETAASFYPGGAAELGAHIWATDKLALAIKGGYRYAKGFVNYIITKDPDSAKVGDKGYLNVDYSGFYFNLGIVLAVWE